MPDNPDNLKYSKDHEWVLTTSDGRIRVGITDYAQRQLGDIVFVEQPNAGDKFGSGDPFGSIESVKAVTEVYVPASGEVTTLNDQLADQPELINEDPYGDGWLIELKVSDRKELDSLLSAAQYDDYIRAEAE